MTDLNPAQPIGFAEPATKPEAMLRALILGFGLDAGCLPSFADAAWFERNTFITRNDIVRFSSRVAGQDAAIFGPVRCKDRGGFLAGFAQVASHLEVGVALSSAIDADDRRFTRTFFGPVFERAVAARNKGDMPVFADDMAWIVSDLLSSPGTEQLGLEAAAGLCLCYPYFDAVRKLARSCAGKDPFFDAIAGKLDHMVDQGLNEEIVSRIEDLAISITMPESTGGYDARWFIDNISIAPPGAQLPAAVEHKALLTLSRDFADNMRDPAAHELAMAEVRMLKKAAGFDPLDFSFVKPIDAAVELADLQEPGRYQDEDLDAIDALLSTKDEHRNRVASDSLLAHALEWPDDKRLFEIAHRHSPNLHKVVRKYMKLLGEHVGVFEVENGKFATMGDAIPLEDLLFAIDPPGADRDEGTEAHHRETEENRTVLLDEANATAEETTSVPDAVISQAKSEETVRLKNEDAHWTAVVNDARAHLSRMASNPPSAIGYERARFDVASLKEIVLSLELWLARAEAEAQQVVRAEEHLFETLTQVVSLIADCEQLVQREDSRSSGMLLQLLDGAKSAGVRFGAEEIERLERLGKAASESAGVLKACVGELQSQFTPERLAKIGPATDAARLAYEAAYDAVSGLLVVDASENAAIEPGSEAPAASPEPEPETLPVESVTAPADTVPVLAEQLEPEPLPVTDPEEPVAIAATPSNTAASGEDVDPLWSLACETIRTLASRGSFALAHHVALAGERHGLAHLPFTSSELKLAAMAGHLNFQALHQNGGLTFEVKDALERTLAVVEEDAFPANATGDARRLAAFASALEPALLGQDQSAISIVERSSLHPHWNREVFPLKEALREVGKTGQPLTVELFRGLKDSDGARRDLVDAIEEVEATRVQLSRLSFVHFITGTEIARHLASKTGEIGSLVTQLNLGGQAAYAAARRFADLYGSDVDADALVHEARTKAAHQGPKKIVGHVRNDLVRHILDVTSACRDYVAAADALREIETVRRGRHEAIRNTLVGAVKRCADATVEMKEAGDQVLSGVSAFAMDVFGRILRVLDGTEHAPEAGDHLLAVHAPLAAVPGLALGKGWLPAPYRPERVIRALSTHSAEGTAANADWKSTVLSRMEEGAFSSAGVLLRAAKGAGADAGALKEIEARRSEIATRVRSAVGARLETVRRALESIEMAGDPAEQEEAAALAQKIDSLDLSKLPVEVPTDARVEEPDDGNVVVDFAGVDRILEETSARVHEINRRRRDELMDVLAAIEARGKVSSVSVERVRRIVEADDLVVAKEWISAFESGLDIPETEKVDTGLSRLIPGVTDFIAKEASGSLAKVIESAEAGRDFGPLEFSRVGPGHRAASRDFLSAYQRIGTALADVKQSQGAAAVVRSLFDAFRQLGITPKGTPDEIATVTAAGGKAVTFSARMDIPQDADSKLLPEFGTFTYGQWKVLVAQKLPSDQEIGLFINHQIGGSMIVVTGAVTTQERRTLAENCRKHRRKLVVIDAAIAASVAAEPQLRAAGMIELAQPFSFAEPFADSGKRAVPAEMFVGRTDEIMKVLDPFGPCIVYGARRNGKTATLRHIANTYHDPLNGFLAVHVDVQGICRANGSSIDDIWPELSKALLEVFRAPATNGEAFEAGILRWLDAKASRRVLLMIDEADDLVAADAEHGFGVFLQLQRLMENRSRRFKVVIAGLRNVSRIVKDGNAPLRSMTSNPVRIGPFVGAELAEAERLVSKPLGAMGYVFKSRELKWRILTAANYSPVLIQVFCRKFLELLAAKPFDHRTNPPYVIDEATVTAALSDPGVMAVVAEHFTMAIDYDQRYKLLTYIIALGDMTRVETGDIAEGMTVGEIYREAVYYWKNLFEGIDGLALVEDTIDEMEGLGLVRRVEGDRWALRSPTVRRYLGNRDAIERSLLSFAATTIKVEPDFSALRRAVKAPGAAASAEADYPSPFTNRQENLILEARKPVIMITGSAATDIGLAADVLKNGKNIFEAAGGMIHRFEPKRGPKDIAVGLTALCGRTGKHILLVDERQPWDADFIREALATAVGNKRMDDRGAAVRAVFVAGPEKTLQYILDPRTSSVHLMVPRPWSSDMLDRAGAVYGVTLLGEERDCFKRVTGGLNGLAHSAMRAVAGKSDKRAALEEWFSGECAKGDLQQRIGILQPLAPLFAEAAHIVDYGEVTVREIGELMCSRAENPTREAANFVKFSRMMGLASVAKDDDGESKVSFNPIVKSVMERTA